MRGFWLNEAQRDLNAVMTQSHMSNTEMSIFRTDLNERNLEPRLRATRTIKREIDYIECRPRAPIFGGELSDFAIASGGGRSIVRTRDRKEMAPC